MDPDRSRRGDGGPRSPRSGQAARAGHAHHRHRPPGRSRLRADRPALPRRSESFCRRLCLGLVQIDPPRHGADRPLSRARGSSRSAHLARPAPSRHPRACRRRRHRLPQGHDPRFRALDPGAGVDSLGVGVDLPRQRQARRGQRRPDPPPAAEGLGGERSTPAGAGARHLGGDPGSLQRRPSRWQDRREEGGVACRSDRARGLCRGRTGCQERWPRR